MTNMVCSSAITPSTNPSDATTSTCTTIYTHAGVFHADEVLAVGILEILHGKQFEVKRVREVPSSLTSDVAFILDIGGGQYDHHQEGAPLREDGTPYATAGLVWRAFGHDLVGSQAAVQKLDRDFFEVQDAVDNGGGVHSPLSNLISAFNPTWEESEDRTAADRQFRAAVEVVKPLLKRLFDSTRVAFELEAKAKELATHAQEWAIWLDRYIPVAMHLKETDIKWVGSNSLRGGYQLVAVRDEKGQPKALFPEEIRGYAGPVNEDGITFCHKGGFTATFTDKKAAQLYYAHHLCR